jgi:hypothetical protein
LRVGTVPLCYWKGSFHGRSKDHISRFDFHIAEDAGIGAFGIVNKL